MAVRIFYASDVHGSEVCFRKFVNAAKAYKADVLVLGGDITGKALVPVVEEGGVYRAELFGKVWEAKGEVELEKVLSAIRASGFYTVVMDRGEYEKVVSSPQLVSELFDKAMAETVRSWVRLAEERLKGTGVEVYIMPGNDDRFVIDEALAESSLVVNPDGCIVEIKGGLKLVSLGASNPTPWRTPRELPEEEIYKRLSGLAAEAGDPSSTILNVHAPPHGTVLDLAPLLDSELKVVRRSGEVEMVHVGSAAVRRVIEEFQPLAGLHGHVHESKGVAKVGRAICFNPGSDYSSGALRGLLLVVEPGKVKSYMFTYG